MKEVFFWIGTAFSALLGVVGIRVDETPSYEVVVRDEAFEVRRYEARVVAETRDRGEASVAANASFRRLAAYIFGANAGAAKVAMTAPVETQGTPEKIAMTAPVVMEPVDGEWVMRFFLPQRFTLATAPRPNDPRVVLREEPAAAFAVVRFTGRSTPEKAAECEAALRAWMRTRAIAEGGPARLAAYDPPFTLPFMRRNEVMIPVLPS